MDVAGEDHVDMVGEDDGEQWQPVRIVCLVEEGVVACVPDGVVVHEHEGQGRVPGLVKVLVDPGKLGVADAATPVAGDGADRDAVAGWQVVAVDGDEMIGAVIERIVEGTEVVFPEGLAVLAGFAVAVVVPGDDIGGDVELLEEAVEFGVLVGVFEGVELAEDEVAGDDDEIGVEEVDFVNGA